MKKGFTLIELMVVIAVIAILSTIALIGLRAAQDAAKDTKKVASITGLQNALERYYGDYGSYPSAGAVPGLASLTAGAFTGYIATSLWYGSASDHQMTGCAATPVGPCVSYTQTASTDYTILFVKKSGGTLTYVSPK